MKHLTSFFPGECIYNSKLSPKSFTSRPRGDAPTPTAPPGYDYGGNVLYLLLRFPSRQLHNTGAVSGVDRIGLRGLKPPPLLRTQWQKGASRPTAKEAKPIFHHRILNLVSASWGHGSRGLEAIMLAPCPGNYFLPTSQGALLYLGGSQQCTLWYSSLATTAWK